MTETTQRYDVVQPDSAEHTVIDILRLVPEIMKERVRSRTNSTLINRPNNAFDSDQWTAATIAGLSRVDFEGKNVVEIGVGAGTIVISMKAIHDPELITVSDYIATHVGVTRRNANTVLSDNANPCGIKYVEGSQNLVCWVQDEKFDIVYACIPQVSLPDGESINDDAHAGDYIPPDSVSVSDDFAVRFFKEVNNECEFLEKIKPEDFDLHLNMALLEQIRYKQILKLNGAVYLTLGGRPGLSVLQSLVSNAGFNFEIQHREVIQQDPKTNIKALVDHESMLQKAWPDYTFSFYKDETASVIISAELAHARMVEGMPVYHDIFVIKASLT